MHINNCSFLGIPDDHFAGNPWISWFPRFHIKSWVSIKIMILVEFHGFHAFPPRAHPPGPWKGQGITDVFSPWAPRGPRSADFTRNHGIHVKIREIHHLQELHEIPMNSMIFTFSALRCAPAKTLHIPCKLHAFLGSDTVKVACFGKKWGIWWFPCPFWWNHLKGSPKPPFWWQSSKNQTLAAPGPSKHLRNALV